MRLLVSHVLLTALAVGLWACDAGQSCWDLNGNGQKDSNEDTNKDGKVDVGDCRGAAGPAGLACWDLNGNGAEDPDEDINEDGVFDSGDCKGPPGTAGVHKSAEMLSIAAAYCASLIGQDAGSSSAVEFSKKMTGDEACALGPEPTLNPKCYGVILVHNYSTSTDKTDFAIFNAKACDAAVDVFPGQRPFACCGISKK